MVWVFFEAVTGRGIQPQDFGTECWKCLRLFSSSPGLCLRLVLVSGLMSSGFVVCFGVWGCVWPKNEIG